MREYHLLPRKVWKCVIQEHEKDALMHEKHTRTEELEKLKLDTETETPYLQHDYFHTTYYRISRYYWWRGMHGDIFKYCMTCPRCYPERGERETNGSIS